MHTTPSGLEYRDLTKGTGEPATRGDIVVVHYTGWLKDGKEFDSSVGGEPSPSSSAAARSLRAGTKE